MKSLMKTIIIIVTLFAVVAPKQLTAQGAFENLNFEEAGLYLTSIPAGQEGGVVSAASAFPGWTVAGGLALQNTLATGAEAVGIWGPDAPSSMILQGQWSAVLQAGTGDDGPNTPATLSQSGLIPPSTQSIRFYGSGAIQGSLSVSINGQNIAYSIISSIASYDVYGANIPQFANQTVTLEFTENLVFPSPGYGGVILDNIQFSSANVVPEPSIIALGAFGGLLFGVRKWFARR